MARLITLDVVFITTANWKQLWAWWPHYQFFFFYWEFAGWPHHKGTSLTCEDLASAVEMALKMLLLSSTCSSLGSKLSSLASNVAERAWISKISEPVNNVVIWSEQSDTLQQYRDVLNLSSWYGCTCHHCLVSINGLGWRKVSLLMKQVQKWK